MKGIPGLVQTWAVVNLRDEAVEETILEQSQNQRTLTDLVGRDEETGLLRRAWQSVKDEGRGQVVYITGEAGIGKSSLIDGLRAEVRIEGLSQGVMRCSPYHINSALYPLIEYTKRLAGWQSEDSVEERLSKLEALLKTYDQSLDEALRAIAQTGEEFWLAELYRLKGKLLLESSGENNVDAEASFHKAIEIARSQNARGWEQRAATCLAKFWADQNIADEARQLLAPIHGWFTEGFDTVDYKTAKTCWMNWINVHLRLQSIAETARLRQATARVNRSS